LASFQEEVPLVLINDSFGHLELDAHLHGKKKLVLLEERSARDLVHLLLVVLHDARDSVLEHELFATLDGIVEEGFVPVKTELIHWINLVEVIQYEVQNGSLLATSSVGFSGVINLLQDDFSLFQRLLDFIRLLFRRLQGVNQSDIFKEISFGFL
jgi:hypothetical protein